jgi:hypothetical protein
MTAPVTPRTNCFNCGTPYGGVHPSHKRLVRDGVIEPCIEREAGSTDALRAALERGYLIADDLDSNHARWVIQKLADEAGITFNLPPVNEPNNRLREQLSEARAALARLSRESDR